MCLCLNRRIFIKLEEPLVKWREGISLNKLKEPLKNSAMLQLVFRIPILIGPLNTCSPREPSSDNCGESKLGRRLI